MIEALAAPSPVRPRWRSAILDQPSMRRSIAMAVAGIMVPVLIAGDQWHSGLRSPDRAAAGSPAMLVRPCSAPWPWSPLIALRVDRWPVMFGAGPGRAVPDPAERRRGGCEPAGPAFYLVMGGGCWLLIRARRNDLCCPRCRPLPPAGLARWLKPLLAAAVVLLRPAFFTRMTVDRPPEPLVSS